MDLIVRLFLKLGAVFEPPVVLQPIPVRVQAKRRLR